MRIGVNKKNTKKGRGTSEGVSIPEQKNNTEYTKYKNKYIIHKYTFKNIVVSSNLFFLIRN